MSTQGPDLIGRKIGEYEITSRVGVGGMGAVYEGKQPLIGKRVAVKVLLPQLSNEPGLVERFLAEARAVNEIRHRGIVDIFSFGQLPEGSHYFVMEYLEGRPFDALIKERAPVSIPQAVEWLLEVLDALGAAHAAGIIHRDIKPSNLFLVDTGRGKPYVKLLDFGIAKLGVQPGSQTPQTRASVILGTPDYISPEQAKGRPISPQTDLYAVGCVLFEMVTGFRVFRGENTLQTMWAHVEDTPPLPSSIVPTIPPAFDELVLWALEKDPQNRPPSAHAMAEQLERIRASVTTDSLPPLTGEAPRSSYTPPPSVRQRVAGSSPGIAQPTLKTPTARSGAQRPLGTPAPGQGPRSLGDTKLSPIALSVSNVSRAPLAETRVEGVSPVVTDPRVPVAEEPEEPSAEAAQEPVSEPIALPAPSRTPLIAVLLGLLVVLGAGAVVLLMPGNPPQVVKVEQTGDDADPAKTEPVKTEPAKTEPAKTEPAKTEPAKTEPQTETVKPVTPPPDAPKKAPGITTAQLEARLAKLEQRLAEHEAKTGEKDKVLRQFFEAARKQIAEATTDAQRREAAGTLNDISAQFSGR